MPPCHLVLIKLTNSCGLLNLIVLHVNMVLHGGGTAINPLLHWELEFRTTKNHRSKHWNTLFMPVLEWFPISTCFQIFGIVFQKSSLFIFELLICTATAYFNFLHTHLLIILKSFFHVPVLLLFPRQQAQDYYESEFERHQPELRCY